MGMDTSCGNKISLSKLFLFFFFQAFINVLDFLQHQFHVFLQALNLAQSQANQNNYLIGQLRPTPVPAYTVANPYAGFGYGCCGQTQCCC